MTHRHRLAGLVIALAVSAADAAATADDLFGAIAIDNLRDVRRLVQDRVFSPSLVDARGDTLLIAAIRNDAVNVASFLIDGKAVDLEATNGAGETPLMMAAYRRQRGLVERLLTRDAEVNRTGWTALHYAASVGDGEIVGILLEHAAYIDAESPNRTTPLMMAARGGFEPVCRQLVEAGADPTPINERDLDAAGFARRAGNDALARWFDERAAGWRAKYGVPPSTRRPTGQ